MATVLITGSNRGIGLATAKKFLSEGWTVIGASRSGKTDISDSNFHDLKLEITSDSDIKDAVEFVKEKLGQIDVLVNNAGIAPEPWDETVVIDLVRKSIENNLVSVINFTEQLLPYIKVGGKILNISSMMASLTDINSNSDVDSLG